METTEVFTKKDKGKVANNGRYVPERVAKLRDRLLSTAFKLDIERAKYYTRAYKQTEGQPPCLRAAKGLEETLRSMPIRIEKEEQIVGSKSTKDWADPLYIEATTSYTHIMLALALYGSGKTVEEWVAEDPRVRNGFFGSRGPSFWREMPNISQEEYRELKEEIVPYWKDKTIHARKRTIWEQNSIPSGESVAMEGWFVSGASPQGHVTVGIKKVLDMGFKGIARQAAERSKVFRDEFEKGKLKEQAYLRKNDFLEATQITAAAVCEFAERYARLAEDMAQRAKGQRKLELLEIAERCRHVPAEPPRDFMEALQAIWLTQAVVLISYGGGSITCPGRVDQFLYPYYRQDLTAGRITRDQALEGIMEYIVKLATVVYFGPNNVTIGGVDKNGEDVVNEVSYLFLEAHKRLKGCGRIGLAVRISPKTPRGFLTKACEVHRECAGVAFHNDEVVIRGLLEDGYSLEDARNYSIVGCAEPTGTGNNNGYTASNGIVPAAILELVLNEGKRYAAGWKQVKPPVASISSFRTFDDVKRAFIEELSGAVEKCVEAGYLKDQVIADNFPLPLLSSTIEGCVESGEDVTRGGARYNHVAIGTCSLATGSDSLAAIKWAVFKQKLLTMEELGECLRSNFQEREDIRQRLLHAPKYGSDDSFADELAVWVADVHNKEVRKHRFWMGGVHRPYILSSATHVAWGARVGASADGRLAGTPLTSGITPTNGSERNGLTAVLRSAAKVGAIPVSDGMILNAIINPLTIRTEEGLSKFASLVEGYFALGGRQVQFNPISKEMLLDAQKHPENYTELVVKVSGFSFRFIDLSKRVQDDIIARTEFQLA
jgi:pyruvate formate-lyase/glycerol dehydratase family glycyl radical enzyme